MVERIGPEEAKRRMEEDGYVYVDVRSVEEFEQGHPEGAYNVPLLTMGPSGMTPNPDFVEVMQRSFEPGASIIIGCKSGGRSLRAAQMLGAHGFRAVVDQRAGFSGACDPFGRVEEAGWSDRGLPSSRTPTPGRSYRELCSG